MSFEADVAIIGAGISGLSVAYYLKKQTPSLKVVLVDGRSPHSFTSAQSGENYRDWWPQPVMKSFIGHSIELMEGLARDTDNQISLTRNGYILATRRTETADLMKSLNSIYGDKSVRQHTETHSHYDTTTASLGADVLLGRGLIKNVYTYYDDDVSTLIHLRRGGTVDSQQMGQHFMKEFRALGGKFQQGHVLAIEKHKLFTLSLGQEKITAHKVVNAAGPFAGEVARMLGEALPLSNILQQKIAFEDVEGCIDRQMPFTIDIDDQHLDWTDEELELLEEDKAFAWVARGMPSGVHCRPEGGVNSKWVKLGWAYNCNGAEPSFEPSFDDYFPEVVLHGAAKLHPALKAYYGALPSRRNLYGGYYTMTKENWPLIGPTAVDGMYVSVGMSGFGTMAACASGELCAKWVLEGDLPDYASALSLRRYNDSSFIKTIQSETDRGIL